MHEQTIRELIEKNERIKELEAQLALVGEWITENNCYSPTWEDFSGKAYAINKLKQIIVLEKEEKS